MKKTQTSVLMVTFAVVLSFVLVTGSQAHRSNGNGRTDPPSRGGNNNLTIFETLEDQDGAQGFCGSPRFVFNASKILPPELPADFDAFWARSLREQAAIPLGARVLDVGCGTGSSLLPAAEVTGANGYVIGIDICPG